ncbi:MAG: TFIIB-type zinc ribbon-containing protein [archaeon]
MTSYIKKCPECGGINLILNKERGEMICKDCGLVIEEKMIDFGQEWREFDHEQSEKRRRTGAPMTYSVDSSEPIIIEQEGEVKIVKIGDFIDNLIYKNKEKVDVLGKNLEVLRLNDDIKVVSFDNDYDIGFRRVSEVSRHPANEVFEIKTESGRKVKVTGNHSVFTVKENKVMPIKVDSLKTGEFLIASQSIPVETKEPEINLLKEFIEVSDSYKNIYLRNFSDQKIFTTLKLKYGQKTVKNWIRHKTVPLYVLKSIKFNYKNIKNFKIGIYSSKNTIPLKIEINEDFCRLLGFYVSEGTSRPSKVIFSFGEHESDYINDVKKTIKKIFNINCSQKHNKQSAVQVEVPSKLLSILFSEILEMGKRAKEKRIPNLIYSLNNSLRLAFLKAYIDGDGSKFIDYPKNMNRPQVCLSTTSVNPELTNDFLYLYSQFGINANYQEVFINGHIINKTGQYIVGSLSTRTNVTNPDSLVRLGFLEDELPINKGKPAIETFIPAPQEYRKEWKFRNRIRITKKLAVDIAEKHNDRDLLKLARADFSYFRITDIKKTKSTNGYAYDLTVPFAQNFLGGRGGLFLHNTKFDRGLGTDIGQKGEVYQLQSKERNKYFRLRKWQHRVSTAIERNLKLALAELKRVSSYLKLPASVEEESARIYTMAVQRGLVRGRSMESVVAGALYAACRRHEVPRTLDELSEASGIDKKEIGRTYRFITRELGIRILPSNPVDYIPRFASALKLNPETQSKAVEILEKAQKAELTSGRGPTGIAAASLYVATLINNEKRTQREVADIAGVTEVTIRNRYKELLRELKLKDEIKKKANIDDD